MHHPSCDVQADAYLLLALVKPPAKYLAATTSSTKAQALHASISNASAHKALLLAFLLLCYVAPHQSCSGCSAVVPCFSLLSSMVYNKAQRDSSKVQPLLWSWELNRTVTACKNGDCMELCPSVLPNPALDGSSCNKLSAPQLEHSLQSQAQLCSTLHREGSGFGIC